ncbi:MAG: RagB/SusD family nutrient uptake outer membrane protein [Chitinophagaceae bacterium]|nr:RagB/SusD family nutrient uptake outer membrane protein [Chitinophagaceae bacterium]
MTIRTFIAVVSGVLVVTASSCKKFLATYSQNQVFVTKATDLDEILVGEGYPEYCGDSRYLFIMDDDAVENPPAETPAGGDIGVSFLESFYYWQPNPYLASNGYVATYEQTMFYYIYKSISRINTVIFNVPLMRAKGEPDSILVRVDGEAHFLRGLYYLMLVNTFGEPYSPATANKDIGVPLKTDPAIEDKFFSRATVKQVYDQVVADLQTAEKELERFNAASVLRANQAAAQALLSRVYLYMENYDSAISYADKVTGRDYKITDLNNFDDSKDFLQLKSPETIFNLDNNMSTIVSVLFDNTIYTTDVYRASDDLLNSFPQGDLRKDAFFKTTSTGAVPAKAGKDGSYDVSDAFLIRLPEIYLNKAEALAISGKEAEAIAVLQELRKNRLKPENLTTVSLSGADLVNFIRDERRRELCFETHRWFDLRRYAVNSKYPYSKTIHHISYAYNATGRYVQGYYELKPYDQDKTAYVVPIHPDEISFNQGVLTNEQRPVRPLIK